MHMKNNTHQQSQSDEWGWGDHGKHKSNNAHNNIMYASPWMHATKIMKIMRRVHANVIFKIAEFLD